MRLYHRTYEALSILTEGFRDGEGHYGTNTILRGVWLSDIPLDANDRRGSIAGGRPSRCSRTAARDRLGREDLREFLIPAGVLNRYGPPQLLSRDEEDELIDPRFTPPPDWDSESE